MLRKAEVESCVGGSDASGAGVELKSVGWLLSVAAVSYEFAYRLNTVSCLQILRSSA